MAFAIGVLLAVAIFRFTSFVGMERERGFYPVVLMVVASYYDLFAVMGGSTAALLGELGATVAFVALASVGFRRNLWIVAAGLTGHGLFDFVHAALIANAGVPDFWPMFCGAFDVTAGAYLALRLRRGAAPLVARLAPAPSA